MRTITVLVALCLILSALSTASAKGPQTNTKLGSSALGAKNPAPNNTAVGFQALEFDTAGAANTAVGSGALQNNNGNANVAVGISALNANTLGDENTAVGGSTLLNNVVGNDVTGVGFAALENSTGSGNTGVGSFALFTNVSGTENTAIGHNADVSADNLTNATAVGAGAVVTASNQVQIGRDGFDLVSIGLFGSGGSPVCVSGTVLTKCTIVSSLRYKENVQTFQPGLTIIERLRPVTFDWKDRKEHDLGVIAEEVAQVEPLLITYDRKGEIEGVKYSQLTVVLINAVKEQQQEIERQREQNAALTQRLDRLEELLRARTASAQ